MNVAQRVIKYCAIAFGFFITFVIISAITTALLGIFGITSYISSEKTEFVSDFEQDFSEYSNVTDLYIDVGIANLNIYRGNELKVEAQNMSKEFECNINDGTLSIKDNLSKNFSFGIFGDRSDSRVVVYIPSSYTLDEARIQTGVGEVRIDELNVHELNLSTGVGKVVIDRLVSSDYTKINNGVGELNIKGASINDLNLESGVGRAVIEGKVTGNSRVKGGIGEIKLKISGNSNDYNVTKKTGIGTIDVNYNGKVASTLEEKYDLNVESGIGSIGIDFVD